MSFELGSRIGDEATAWGSECLNAAEALVACVVFCGSDGRVGTGTVGDCIRADSLPGLVSGECSATCLGDWALSESEIGLREFWVVLSG